MIIDIENPKVMRQAISFSGDELIEVYYLSGFRAFLLWTVDAKAHSIGISFITCELVHYGK